ncbi:unnamed protein product, partial [Aphanomyces euteiches]
MALQDRFGKRIDDEATLQSLQKKNRLPELLHPSERVPSIMAFTGGPSEQLAALRLDRISQLQDREKQIADIKCYLRGEIDHLTEAECQSIAKRVGEFEIGEQNALYRVDWTTKRSQKEQMKWRLVIPRAL